MRNASLSESTNQRSLRDSTSGSGSADAFLSSDVFITHSEKYSLEKLKYSLKKLKQSLESLQECGKRVPSLSTILTILL